MTAPFVPIIDSNKKTPEQLLAEQNAVQAPVPGATTFNTQVNQQLPGESTQLDIIPEGVVGTTPGNPPVSTSTNPFLPDVTSGTGSTIAPPPPAQPLPQQLFDPELDAKLRAQFFDGTQAPTFDGPQTTQIAAPQFTPGGEPLTAPDGSPLLPTVAPRGTFTAPDGSPIVGPQVPTGTAGTAPIAGQVGQFGADGNPLQAAAQQSALEALQNPSGFSSDVAQSTFDRLNRSLTQQFDESEAAANIDAARRGVFQSGIPVQAITKLRGQQAQAQGDIVSRILEQQGIALGSDRARAIGQAGDLGSQDFQRQLQEFQANLAGQGQQFGQELAGAQFEQAGQAQQFGQELAGAQFGAGEQSREFQEALSGFGAEQQAGAQQFGQEATRAQLQDQFASSSFARDLQAQGFNQGLSQDEFQASLASGKFESVEQQRGFENALAEFQAKQSATGQQADLESQALQDLELARSGSAERQAVDAQIQNQDRQFQEQLALQAAQFAEEGGVNQQQQLNNLAQLTQGPPPPGVDPAIWKLLGQAFGGG